MFHQTSPIFSLASLLESPNDYIIPALTHINFSEFAFPLQYKNNSAGEIKINSLNDFNSLSFNIFNLCQLMRIHQNTDSQVYMMMSIFFQYLKSCSSQDKDKYLFQFFGKTSYA
jgi:hypothetical protein